MSFFFIINFFFYILCDCNHSFNLVKELVKAFLHKLYLTFNNYQIFKKLGHYKRVKVSLSTLTVNSSTIEKSKSYKVSFK